VPINRLVECINDDGEISEGRLKITTREEIERKLVRKNKNFSTSEAYGDRWIQVYQDTLLTVAKDREFKGSSFRVFVYLLARTCFENHLSLNSVIMAKNLGMDDSDVRKCIGLMKKKGILVKEVDSEGFVKWRLDPNCGYKGDMEGKVYRKESGGKLYLAVNNVSDQVVE